MKQKIVIKVYMPCDSCRSKAMKIAVKSCGVTKVEVPGVGEDQLTVIGDGVDSVKLTRSLRKKLGFASILSVEEVKDKKEPPGKKDEPKKPVVQCPSMNYCPCPVVQCPSMNYCPCPQQFVVCDAPDPVVCSIM